MPESRSRRFRIDAEHPCTDGHFPDEPIVPGVMLLDYVRISVKDWKPGLRIKGFSSAKFHRPFYLGETFEVTLTETGDFSVSFVCHQGDLKLASGFMTLEERD